MTREDLYYLPPDPDSAERRCMYPVDGEECSEPTDGGPLCDAHPADTPEEYDAYMAKAA